MFRQHGKQRKTIESGIVIYRSRGGKFHPYNGKIADITEADILKHTVDISAYVPVNCVAVIIDSIRIGGTDNLLWYPNEGVSDVIDSSGQYDTHIIAIINQRLQYALETANDSFEIYMWGFLTEG